MFSLHAVLLSQYGISIVLQGNHWENGGNQGDNGERASLLFTSYFNSGKRSTIATQGEERPLNVCVNQLLRFHFENFMHH